MSILHRQNPTTAATVTAAAAIVGATVLYAAVGLPTATAAPTSGPAPTPSPALTGGTPAIPLTLSVRSGPPGTVVHLSGNAGPGCVPGQTWFGVEFEPFGDLATGPFTSLGTAIAPDGAWSATFTIPSYLGGSATRGLNGAPTAPGLYQFAAPSRCQGTPRLDAQATFQVTPGAVPSAADTTYVGMAATPDGGGYWLVGADGGVFGYGDARSHGSLPADGVTPQAPIVGIAATPDGGGYWLVGADGGVFGFGDAAFSGSLPATGITPAAPVVGMAATSDGGGYWLLGADGGVFAYGDATFAAAGAAFEAPYDAIAATPDGRYLLTVADGVTGTFYPSGQTFGALVGSAQAASLVGTALSRDGGGAWETGSDGGVFTSGDAAFHGSLPGDAVTPAAPVTAIATTPDGGGYWLLGGDGGVFSFGDAGYFGSAA